MRIRTDIMYLNLNLFIGLIFILFIPFNGFSQEKTDDQLLFSNDKLLEITLRSDYKSILHDREDKPGYHDASIIYQDSAGSAVQLPARVKVRGNFRKDPEHCRFPPLLVNFKKEEVKGTLFNEQNKLKLVTPCQRDIYVLREYMIYKLYNLITDYSFRVRLLKVNYFDTIRNKPYFDRYSFFLEDNDLMAKRNQCKIIDNFYNPYQLNRKATMKLDLFEYMIGNKDWWITSHKNINLIQHDTVEQAIAVPYDFDMSGFVDASYAKPAGVPESQIVDPQYYKGICMTSGEEKEMFDYYNNMKDRFVHEIRTDPLYPGYLKSQSIDYLNRFYSVINNPSRVKTEIEKKCVKYQEFVQYKMK